MTDRSAATVYKYRDARGILLYIGVTTKRTGRARQHSRNAEWWDFVATAEFAHYATEAEAYAAEAAAILEFRPIFNIERNLGTDELRAIYLASVSALGEVTPPEAPPSLEGAVVSGIEGVVRANRIKFSIPDDRTIRYRLSRLAQAPHRLAIRGVGGDTFAQSVDLLNNERELFVASRHALPDGTARLSADAQWHWSVSVA